jgi:hypothetical protein
LAIGGARSERFVHASKEKTETIINAVRSIKRGWTRLIKGV